MLVMIRLPWFFSCLDKNLEANSYFEAYIFQLFH